MDKTTIYQTVVKYNGEKHERISLTCTDLKAAGLKAVDIMVHKGLYVSDENHTVDEVIVREVLVSPDGENNEVRVIARSGSGDDYRAIGLF